MRLGLPPPLADPYGGEERRQHRGERKDGGREEERVLEHRDSLLLADARCNGPDGPSSVSRGPGWARLDTAATAVRYKS